MSNNMNLHKANTAKKDEFYTQLVDIENELKPLDKDGDFRSEECIEILKKSDIVVTNPPFSLFREYVAQLIEYKKSLS